MNPPSVAISELIFRIFLYCKTKFTGWCELWMYLYLISALCLFAYIFWVFLFMVDYVKGEEHMRTEKVIWEEEGGVYPEDFLAYWVRL